MNHFQTGMHNNLRLAVDALQELSEKSKIDLETWIKEIISLKYQMEILADQKGYSLNCKESIPICKGECCKWHYPRNLTHVDFLIALWQTGHPNFWGAVPIGKHYISIKGLKPYMIRRNDEI